MIQFFFFFLSTIIPLGKASGRKVGWFHFNFKHVTHRLIVLYQPCMFPLLLLLSGIFLCFFGIMFHLVSATSMALTLFLFSHRLRAKGKWRILSVQTPMLQKAFNSTNWTHTQQSCQAKLLSHVKDQWGGRKTQTPLLSVYANRRVKRGKNRVIEQSWNCTVTQTKKASAERAII